MIDDDEDDYEGYFLRPANEYNIKEKIIQANQESFAIPTPPSPRQHVSGERRVTFREQLVDYEPDEYSSEDDGYGGDGGGGGGGGGSSGRKKNAVIETVADVHRDGEVDGSGADTIIEELHLDDRTTTPEPQEEEEVVVEEEQLEGDYDEEHEGTEDRMEKHKTGVEGESVVSDEEEEEEEEDVVEEETVHEEQVEEEDEEEPTDGSSMDTEIHNPESSEDISSSPLKTYRSEADSRSGSGDSQAEEGNGGEDGEDTHYHGNDNDDESYQREGGPNGVDDHDSSSSDGERPLEAHRTKRSTTCRRKCCRHKKSAGEKLPYYNGFRSEYGLSREELEEKKRRLEARRQRVRERQQRRTAEQRQKAQSNEEAFAAWLHGKLRSSINKHQNMYDVKQQSAGSASGRLQQQQQQPQNPKYRRRNGIHTMQQISYG
uniref:Coiled-coil domain-containing protein 181 n=1 Tax=Anopheles farauti TaxID=69004 RepID=A0A182Q7P7_9DIPT